MIVEFIDTHRLQWGIEPICTVLTQAGMQIAPSTYYAHKKRAPSPRKVRDEELSSLIMTEYERSAGIYGIRKIHAQLRRRGVVVARCTVERLCRSLGIRGVVRGKFPRAHKPEPATERPSDLVERAFTADAPNKLWVADITYVRTLTGWVYVAFVLDVFSRKIVGWQTSTRLYADLAIDALSMGLWMRDHAGEDISGLIHHSDRGVQYRSIAYSERLAASGVVASVGSKGDSYDNAMAEALNSLFKHEVVYRKSWPSRSGLEIAVAEWVQWYNTERLHSSLGYISPDEAEAAYWRSVPAADEAA